MENAYYHPQTNPAERINRVILSSIRTYIKKYHRDWDKEIHKIACALRTSYHESTKFTPYYLNFGKEISHSAYTLDKIEQINDLDLLDSDHSSEYRNRQLTELDQARKLVQEHIKKAHEKYSKNYNLRKRPIQYSPGQTIWRRNFKQSDASKKFSSKLSPTWIKCKIKSKKGNSTYLLEDEYGKELGIYHCKDLKA